MGWCGVVGGGWGWRERVSESGGLVWMVWMAWEGCGADRSLELCMGWVMGMRSGNKKLDVSKRVSCCTACCWMLDPIYVLCAVLGLVVLFKIILPGKREERRRPGSSFVTIEDKYSTLEEVQTALRTAGLESSSLVLGVDFTRSNEYNGTKTFGGKCLHAIDYAPNGVQNPYQEVISLLGRTLAPFDDGTFIPSFLHPFHSIHPSIHPSIPPPPPPSTTTTITHPHNHYPHNQIISFRHLGLATGEQRIGVCFRCEMMGQHAMGLRRCLRGTTR